MKKKVMWHSQIFRFHGLLKMKLVHFSPINEKSLFASPIVHHVTFFISHCKDISFRTEIQLKYASWLPFFAILQGGR